MLEAIAIPCALVATVADLADNPHVRHRRGIVEVDHPHAGTVPMQVSAFQLSGRPLEVRRPTPAVREHSAEILSDWLGDPAGRVERLAASGVI